MYKKMIVCFMLFLFIIGCKKQQQNTDNTENFTESVVTKETHYYKTNSLSMYGGKLLRGQKISLGAKTEIVLKGDLKHVLTEMQLPGDDKTYWVVSKYILKNGYEIVNAIKTPRRIVTIRKDSYYYNIADIQSHRTEIQAGIKALLLEERSEWAKVSLINGEFWMKMEDLSSNDVNIEMKRYFSEMGTGTITASSFYSGSLGQERLHSPDKAFDGNIKTAWIEGNDNNGVGEWIKIDFKTGKFKFSLAMINGYAVNENMYKLNNRIKKIRVETETDNRIIELEDNRLDYQELGNFEGSWVKFTIEDIHPGRDKDASIGDIRIKHISTIAEGSLQREPGTPSGQN